MPTDRGRKPMDRRHIVLALVSAAILASGPAPAQEGAACRSLVPAAMGGPVLTAENMISLRWLATSNYELVWRGRVYLLDTYFDRGPRNRPTGIVPGEVKRADAIFIGHAHFDHISDVGTVSQLTKARVIGAPISIETAAKLGM